MKFEKYRSTGSVYDKRKKTGLQRMGVEKNKFRSEITLEGSLLKGMRGVK